MTHVTWLLDYVRGVKTPTPAGFAATWRYTQISLWFYIAFALAGPVARTAEDLASGRHVVRLCVVSILILATIWWSCRPLVAAARQGLGHEVTTWRERALFLTPALAVLPVAWWPPAALPVGLAFVPWVVVAFIAIDLRNQLRWWWLAGWLVALVAAAWVTHRPEVADLDRGTGFVLGFFAAFVSLTSIFQVWLWELVLKMRSSGESEAELAGVRERLRMAADLHDVQGHHLQVIALKAELAARQLDRDPEAARASLQEIQQVARDAISETRDLVRGYRSTNLREELGNAASVLEAAGATVAVEFADDVDEPLFAIVLREATTNMLRHSRATAVTIVAQRDRLLVENDGAPEDEDRGQGSGLAALTERVAAEGGRLEVRRNGDIFGLEVTL